MERAIRQDRHKVLLEIVALRYEKLWSANRIIKHLQDEYGYTKGTAEVYVSDARRFAGERYAAQNVNAMDDAIMRLERMIEVAIDNEDLRVALAVQKELNAILKLVGRTEEALAKENITINITTNDGNNA